MLTLSFSDLGQLSNGQREALSGFILSFHTQSYSAPKKRYVEPTPEDAIGKSPEEAFSEPADTATGRVPIVPQLTSSATDKLGLPWDERIHSSSKNFNADGTWRKKRGVADALVAEVEAQLNQLMSVPAPEVKTVPAPPEQTNIVPAPPAPVAVMPVPVAASPVPLPTDFDAKTAFVNFIKRSADAVTAKKITQEEVKEICIKHGVADIPLLGHRLDLVPTIAIEVETLIATRG